MEFTIDHARALDLAGPFPRLICFLKEILRRQGLGELAVPIGLCDEEWLLQVEDIYEFLSPRDKKIIAAILLLSSQMDGAEGRQLQYDIDLIHSLAGYPEGFSWMIYRSKGMDSRYINYLTDSPDDILRNIRLFAEEILKRAWDPGGMDC